MDYNGQSLPQLPREPRWRPGLPQPRPRGAVQDPRPPVYTGGGFNDDDKIKQLEITSHVEFSRNRKYLIGEGTYGQVYMAWYTGHNGERIPAVVKVLMCAIDAGSKQKADARLMREIITWKKVSQHDNVADFLGIYCSTRNSPPHLVMPYYQHNRLLEYLQNRQHHERLYQAGEIARGLDLLHENNVIHGDLKPENILVSDQGRAQISDFGLSVIPDMKGFTTTATLNRNPRHSAPELIPLRETGPIHPTKESDVFSLGILFLQLFDGRVDCLPYQHRPMHHNDPHDTRVLRAIHEEEDRPRHNYHPNISEDRWALLEASWVTDPRARPTVANIRSWLPRV